MIRSKIPRASDIPRWKQLHSKAVLHVRQKITKFLHHSTDREKMAVDEKDAVLALEKHQKQYEQIFYLTMEVDSLYQQYASWLEESLQKSIHGDTPLCLAASANGPCQNPQKFAIVRKISTQSVHSQSGEERSIRLPVTFDGDMASLCTNLHPLASAQPVRKRDKSIAKRSGLDERLELPQDFAVSQRQSF